MRAGRGGASLSERVWLTTEGGLSVQGQRSKNKNNVNIRKEREPADV